jgi:hypothetical protein
MNKNWLKVTRKDLKDAFDVYSELEGIPQKSLLYMEVVLGIESKGYDITDIFDVIVMHEDPELHDHITDENKYDYVFEEKAHACLDDFIFKFAYCIGLSHGLLKNKGLQ